MLILAADNHTLEFKHFIPFINNLEVFILQEVAQFTLSGEYGGHQLPLDLLFLLELISLVPLLESNLALATEQ